MRPAQNARWRQRSQVAANHSNIRTIHDVGDTGLHSLIEMLSGRNEIRMPPSGTQFS